MSKKNKQKKKAAEERKQSVEPIPQIKNRWLLHRLWYKYWDPVDKWIKAFVYIGGIISSLFLIPQVRDFFKSDRQKFEEEKFITGIFVPDDILQNSQQDILIKIGSTIIGNSVDYFRSGGVLNIGKQINIRPDPFNLTVKMIDNKIFIKTDLNNLGNSEPIGTVNYSRWEIEKKNIYKYRENKKYLEVLDANRNVAFSMKYEPPGPLIIRGYFIYGDLVYVVNDSLRIYDRRSQQAARAISVTKRLFNYD